MGDYILKVCGRSLSIDSLIGNSGRQMRRVLGDQRPRELLAAPAKALNPREAHRREICRVGVGFLARH